MQAVIAEALKEMRYGKLPAHLESQLFSVEPSTCGDLQYRPCTVTLKNGDLSDIVYVVAAEPYIRMWGVWPEKDSAKRSIRIEDVATISESPFRLPVKYANEIYKGGESGMGYTIFTIVFSDGIRQACSPGNAVDFIRYPNGKSMADVVSVLPHIGRNEEYVAQAPAYYWCLYAR